MAYLNLTTTKCLKNKKDVASYVEKLLKKLDHDDILQWTMTIAQDDYEDCYAITATIEFSVGTSKTMLKKLEELSRT